MDGFTLSFFMYIINCLTMTFAKAETCESNKKW